MIVHHASMLHWLANYNGPPFDSCVTDPPYHLASIVKRFGGAKPHNEKFAASNPTKAYRSLSRGFMGKEWDGGDIAFRPETWRAVYDALKPGAHLVAFSGTRTYHRMACAIEDAGFEIRDQLAWCYGSGFPKSHDISKAIDRSLGLENQRIITHYKPQGTKSMFDGGNPQPASLPASLWNGWGTALKPAWEPICLARKPLSEKSVAANVLKHGTGAINVDATRIGTTGATSKSDTSSVGNWLNAKAGEPIDAGRFPANLCHDGSEEVLAGFPHTSSGYSDGTKSGVQQSVFGKFGAGTFNETYGDEGSAARFFYNAKAGPLDRIGTSHATVKPVDLMRWLSRLVTPPGGHILEPFAGSGTTGIAAMAEGFDCTMIELEADHVADIERKLAYLRGEGALTFREHDRRRDEPQSGDHGPLFTGAAQ